MATPMTTVPIVNLMDNFFGTGSTGSTSGNSVTLGTLSTKSGAVAVPFGHRSSPVTLTSTFRAVTTSTTVGRPGSISPASNIKDILSIRPVTPISPIVPGGVPTKPHRSSSAPVFIDPSFSRSPSPAVQMPPPPPKKLSSPVVPKEAPAYEALSNSAPFVSVVIPPTFDSMVPMSVTLPPAGQTPVGGGQTPTTPTTLGRISSRTLPPLSMDGKTPLYPGPNVPYQLIQNHFWRNPFPIGKTINKSSDARVQTVEESLAHYRSFILSSPERMAALESLRGKNLICNCGLPIRQCHGSVLLDIGNLWPTTAAPTPVPTPVPIPTPASTPAPAPENLLPPSALSVLQQEPSSMQDDHKSDGGAQKRKPDEAASGALVPKATAKRAKTVERSAIGDEVWMKIYNFAFPLWGKIRVGRLVNKSWYRGVTKTFVPELISWYFRPPPSTDDELYDSEDDEPLKKANTPQLFFPSDRQRRQLSPLSSGAAWKESMDTTTLPQQYQQQVDIEVVYMDKTWRERTAIVKILMPDVCTIGDLRSHLAQHKDLPENSRQILSPFPLDPAADTAQRDATILERASHQVQEALWTIDKFLQEYRAVGTQGNQGNGSSTARLYLWPFPRALSSNMLEKAQDTGEQRLLPPFDQHPVAKELLQFSLVCFLFVFWCNNCVFVFFLQIRTSPADYDVLWFEDANQRAIIGHPQKLQPMTLSRRLELWFQSHCGYCGIKTALKTQRLTWPTFFPGRQQPGTFVHLSPSFLL